MITFSTSRNDTNGCPISGCIDGVRGQTFTFKAAGGGSYKDSPPSGSSKGAHSLTFQATGDPVPHTVSFTT